MLGFVVFRITSNATIVSLVGGKRGNMIMMNVAEAITQQRADLVCVLVQHKNELSNINGTYDTVSFYTVT